MFIRDNQYSDFIIVSAENIAFPKYMVQNARNIFKTISDMVRNSVLYKASIPLAIYVCIYLCRSAIHVYIWCLSVMWMCIMRVCIHTHTHTYLFICQTFKLRNDKREIFSLFSITKPLCSVRAENLVISDIQQSWLWAKVFQTVCIGVVW